MVSAVSGKGRRFDGAQVALTAAAVILGVAVQTFTPQSALRDADLIVVADDGRTVAYHQYRFGMPGGEAQETENAGFGVLRVDPGKALGAEVKLVQGRSFAVQPVQVPHPIAYAAVVWELQHVPLQTP